MKKFLLLVLSIAFIASSTSELDAQAKKYTLFEHFTQASCGPCAGQNPIFQPVYEANKVNAHHIAFHTSWPGVDEMFSYNDPENRSHTSYYGISGVPNMVANGTNIGSPVAADQAFFDANVGESPIAVVVDETNDGTTISGTVTVKVLADPGMGNYVLRVAAVEELIEYNTPPGSNGELEFPNVFRRFLANGQAGEPLTLEVGTDITFDFSYDIDQAVWQPEEMYTLAWVSNETNKEVINSGRAADTNIKFANVDSKVFKKASGAMSSFDAEFDSKEDSDKNVIMTLHSDQPGDWTSSFSVNGNTYTGTETIVVPPGSTSLQINATPGSIAGIGKYELVIETPGGLEQKVNYSLISGVTDLVVFRNDGVDLETPGTDGLATAGADAYASIEDNVIVEALADGTLDDIEHLYYNIGWTFPALTDPLVAQLEAYLDKGNNLFLSGQDIGWDVMSNNANSNGTPAQQAWYSDYLNTVFIDDGDGARTTIIGNTSDDVFMGAGASPVTRPYGPTAIYPDRIAPANILAKPIFSYDANGLETAGTRVKIGDRKIVYLGIGIEQFGSVAVRNQTMKLTHDWFHGLLTDTEFDNAMAALSMGQSFPNPADAEAFIPFDGVWNQDMMLRVTDLNGRLIETHNVQNGTEQIRINTSSFAEGIYFYQLTDGTNIGTPKKLVVMH